MKLYMKQKVLSWKDRFTIKDETGADRYTIEGEFFAIGKKLHVFDMNHNEVAFVQQKVLTFLPRFFVYRNGQQVAEIVKRFTFFRPRYEIAGLGWEVNGSFWEHDYTITKNGREIVSIHKVWMSWGDSYELNIVNGEDEVLTLAVVLAIDAVMDDNSAAAAGAASS